MTDPRPWESLAGLRGSAERCTCSDAQLANVGCDCPAEQNLPVQCECGAFLRDATEIAGGMCRSCHDDALGDPPEPADPGLWVGPEFADEVSLEERWDHYAFEERSGLPYGLSF